MIVKVLGDLDKGLISKAFEKTRKLVTIPKDVHFYFLNDLSLVYLIKLPRKIQKEFLICTHKVSFSLKFKKRKVIVIYLKEQSHQNNEYLIGLLLHEISHIRQIEKGIYKKIYNSYNKVYVKNLVLIRSLKYDKRELDNLFKDISFITILTLKDIYANNYLIRKRLTRYLLSYYKVEFDMKKRLRPVFYKKNIKEAAKKDLSIIKTVFEFELSLLSVILPLYKSKKASKLVRFLERDYEVNIKEVAQRCHELINIYFNKFDKEIFNEEFINTVFLDVYDLLK